MAYITSYKNQNWLLPLSIKVMIPKDHICFLVEEFVDSLDFSRFDLIYGGAGHPAYHPKIIMKILIVGMLSRTRSSRKLAKACRENLVYMYLAEKVQPDFRTIARFRPNSNLGHNIGITHRSGHTQLKRRSNGKIYKLYDISNPYED